MLLKIFLFIWKEYRVKTIVATILMTVVGLLNGISVVSIVPFINVIRTEDAPGAYTVVSVFEKFFASMGAALSPLNLLFFLFGLLCLKSVLTVWKNILLRAMRIDVEIDRKSNLYGLILNAQLSYLYHFKFGRIANVIINETRMIGMLINYIARFSTCIINMMVYVAVAYIISWQLTIVTAALSILIYLLISRVFVRVKKLGYEVANVNNYIQELINYSLSGYKIVKSFVAETIVSQRLAYYLARLKKANIKLVVIESLLGSIYEPLIVLVAIIMYLVYRFDLAVFLTFLVALFRMYQSFKDIQNTHLKMAQFVASLEMYDETVSGFQKHQYHQEKEGPLFTQLKETISFNNVIYSYKTSKHDFTLGPISVTIPRGKVIGFVGKSGSGKSTCVDLVEGFLVPDSGTVELDGKSLSDYDMASFRKKVGYVSQDIFMINDTIAKNIAFGDKTITQEQIENACKLADADEFIQLLPERYDTMLGEGGTRLSGGQKQRIALARALVRNPEILILDEATSALDNESERQVQKSIDALSGELTIIVIAHRFTTVQNADYIYMLEDGKIVEEGTFDTLLAQDGKFHQMYSIGQAR